MAEERKDDIIILSSSEKLDQTAESGSTVWQPFFMSESSGQVVTLTNLLTTSGRSSTNESVQAPKELERMNSIREETFPAEETSSIQRRIPSVIPIVNTPITQQYTLMCNNCNERPMAKQTFCFPDWCNKCDESLWSTREMHWQANPTPCSSLSEAINKTALCHESIIFFC